MNENKYLYLKSGSDIRGTAADGVEGEEIQLTDKAVFDLTIGFCKWLNENGYSKNNKIAVGHDSRISAERIKKAVISALGEFKFEVYDCSYASTPAMFMTTVDLDCAASVQITASHHPFNKNGLKFFTENGGLNSSDIERITELASENYERNNKEAKVISVNYMSKYAERLRNMIKEGVNAENYDKPLDGYKIIVDAGNGVGGFYATDVLEPLGADITGSCFLDKDGMFPNHAPNPENKEAMAYICKATTDAKADLGIIFDTDVDRAGCVDEHGKEINRNRLVALAALIALEGNEGGTIVTDSVTSVGLTKFINEALGGVHYRFKRGYRNVINEQIKLQNEGVNCPLAIETSGHAAFRENYYLDDGAYLITKIIIKMAQMGKEGKKLDSLISELSDPKEEKELRFKIKTENFKDYGNGVIEKLEEYAEKEGWRIADDNREGIRIYFDSDSENGWLLLRLSVHDPIMPLNIESDAEGGVMAIACKLKKFLDTCELLDVSSLDSFIKN
ncbi:MAG: phosphomannomutase/phosphoglucomutase [Acutalibacteraceae bacterium]|nr:phosphomannomutase/phosphoglucomutase [Acutalibacteraceae bacterium]